jgi:hypothetical protein
MLIFLYFYRSSYTAIARKAPIKRNDKNLFSLSVPEPALCFDRLTNRKACAERRLR